MQTKIIEATNQRVNWGKFMLGRFDHEWKQCSTISTLSTPLLREIGWDSSHLLVLDLQTGEGAIFRINPSGHAANDLRKHRIWVCPLFEPFLVWLYRQDVSDLSALPAMIDLPDAEPALWGYRRPGQ